MDETVLQFAKKLVMDLNKPGQWSELSTLVPIVIHASGKAVILGRLATTLSRGISLSKSHNRTERESPSHAFGISV